MHMPPEKSRRQLLNQTERSPPVILKTLLYLLYCYNFQNTRGQNILIPIDSQFSFFLKYTWITADWFKILSSAEKPLIGHLLRSGQFCPWLQCDGSFPHIKQSSDTNWVSYNSTQLCHCLPGDDNRFHRWRAESHKTALHFRHESQVQALTCTSGQLARHQRFPGTLPCIPFICWSAPRTQETYLLHTTCYKGIKGHNFIARGWDT